MIYEQTVYGQQQNKRRRGRLNDLCDKLHLMYHKNNLEQLRTFNQLLQQHLLRGRYSPSSSDSCIPAGLEEGLVEVFYEDVGLLLILRKQ